MAADGEATFAVRVCASLSEKAPRPARRTQDQWKDFNVSHRQQYLLSGGRDVEENVCAVVKAGLTDVLSLQNSVQARPTAEARSMATHSCVRA